MKKKSKSSDRRYVNNVCDGKTTHMGRISTLGRVCLQKWVPSITKDEPI
jgi:hypothetical protein